MNNKNNIIMNFNAGCDTIDTSQKEQPITINNKIGQSVIVTVNPKTNEFIITTKGNPSISFKDSIAKINSCN